MMLPASGRERHRVDGSVEISRYRCVNSFGLLHWVLPQVVKVASPRAALAPVLSSTMLERMARVLGNRIVKTG